MGKNRGLPFGALCLVLFGLLFGGSKGNLGRLKGLILGFPSRLRLPSRKRVKGLGQKPFQNYPSPWEKDLGKFALATLSQPLVSPRLFPILISHGFRFGFP